MPQIFIGGDFVGGCTDVFDGIKQGTLAARLQKAGIAYDTSVQVDPYDSCLSGCTHAERDMLRHGQPRLRAGPDTWTCNGEHHDR